MHRRWYQHLIGGCNGQSNRTCHHIKVIVVGRLVLSYRINAVDGRRLIQGPVAGQPHLIAVKGGVHVRLDIGRGSRHVPDADLVDQALETPPAAQAADVQAPITGPDSGRRGLRGYLHAVHKQAHDTTVISGRQMRPFARDHGGDPDFPQCAYAAVAVSYYKLEGQIHFSGVD
ncbi:hypothetical protein ES703_26545 [subsurface metagenome]